MLFSLREEGSSSQEKEEGFGRAMDMAVHKVAIGSAVLASMLRDFGALVGDCDGVLFGRVERVVSQALEDDDEQPGTREELTAIVTGHFCSGSLLSFYDATGRIDHTKLARISGSRDQLNGDPIIGWFVGRRNTPFRPSMRESAVTRYLRIGPPPSLRSSADSKTQKGASVDINRLSPQYDGSTLRDLAGSPHQLDSRTGLGTGKGSTSAPDSPARSLQRSPLKNDNTAKSGSRASPSPDSAAMKFEGVASSSPCLFLLLTESGSTQAVHTHDYRAYQYCSGAQGGSFFEPRTITIVNLGPAFRTQYDMFRPIAPLPLLPAARSSYQSQNADMVDSWSSSSESRKIHKGIQGGGKCTNSLSKEQMHLDVYCEGYNVEKLASLSGADGVRRVTEVENLYSKMLSKLDSLAKQVCETSAALLEQDRLNAKLREGFMGE